MQGMNQRHPHAAVDNFASQSTVTGASFTGLRVIIAWKRLQPQMRTKLQVSDSTTLYSPGPFGCRLALQHRSFAIFMAEVIHDAQQEFWRSPAVLEPAAEATLPSTIPEMAEA